MYEQRKELYKKIERFSKSRVLCYVTGDRQNLGIQIAQDVIDHFVQHLGKVCTTSAAAQVDT